MPKNFSNPLNDDIWDQLSTDDDLFQPKETPSQRPAKSSGKPQGRSEAMFYTTHGRPDTRGRPMIGNYQFVNLLVSEDVNAKLRKLAEVHKMKLAPFMRWVVDVIALQYESGERPSGDDSGGSKRLPATLAPVMVDVLKAWSKENRMTFQQFMRWGLDLFLVVYYRDGLRPEEPQEFVPDEAELHHWASLTVSKFEGTGVSKGE